MIGPRPAGQLPGFLAACQNLGLGSDDENELSAVFETLFGFPAGPNLWEEELLPTRLSSYKRTELDDLMRDYSLQWEGAGKDKIFFSLRHERDLFYHADTSAETSAETSSDVLETEVDQYFPRGVGRFSLEELAVRAKDKRVFEIKSRVLDWAWARQVSCDSLEPLLQTIKSVSPIAARPRRAGSSLKGRSRWRSSKRDQGHWFRLDPQEMPDNPVDAEELNKERVRILLDRYGVLFRGLLERELPGLRFRDLFRTLLIMELSSELVSGHFFEGISGLQFISNAALAKLAGSDHQDLLFWHNATDPVSLCGVKVEGLELPRRVPGTHLVWHRSKLVLVSSRKGGVLDIRVDVDCADLPRYFGPLENLLFRHERPLASITVETINGKRANGSEYRTALAQRFSVSADHKSLLLTRRR